jgi:hypothetical protein
VGAWTVAPGLARSWPTRGAARSFLAPGPAILSEGRADGAARQGQRSKAPQLIRVRRKLAIFIWVSVAWLKSLVHGGPRGPE